LLPAAGITQLRIDAQVRVRCPVPVETRLSMRSFALRQRQFTLRQITAAGSTLPACIFETILKTSPDPFSFELPPPFGLFMTVRGAIDIRGPLPGKDFQNSAAVFKPSLPVRISQSLRIDAPGLVPADEACLRESPDFPSLPAALE
jgi:hypothetical protein